MCIDNKDFPLPSAYIGIENEAEEGCPTISLEFDVSLKIFILALILSKLETSCNSETKKT
jgi:hypothetical protein